MNFLSDVLTYMRRIIKSYSNTEMKDSLLVDYVNRFVICDIDARIQLFDYKTSYKFQTTPGVTKYNTPLYDVQSYTIDGQNQQVSFYPVYQGFEDPAYANGFRIPFSTQKNVFYQSWNYYLQPFQQVATGDGTSTYNFTLPFFPVVPGHVDVSGIIATGQNVDPPLLNIANQSSIIQAIPSTSYDSAIYITTQDSTNTNAIVADSGIFLESDRNYGVLMRPGNAPNGNLPLNGGYSTTLNTVNYSTGEVNVTFTDDAGAPINIPSGNAINAQVLWYNPGMPRSVLFYNNVITIVPTPNTQYCIELQGYLSPSAFLATSESLSFGYMAEYIARGAVRKILSDTGDMEQFAINEPLFKEQENLVWKRSQRQFTATPTPTIYSAQINSSGISNNTWGF